MVEIANLKEKSPEEILEDMNNGKVGRPTDTPFHVAHAAVELRIVDQLCDTISKTDEMLADASIAIKQCTENSVKTLTDSIDDFRKSNERTSPALIALTAVIGFAALVQAATLIFE